jgi:hypothetical protein
VITVDLATRLKAAGLAWHPENGDVFFIPDRDLDDQLFAVSEMMVEIRTVPGGREIAFNGSAEWALDAILQREVVWLPSEEQLRDRLGDAFVSLSRVGGGYRCDVADPDGAGSYQASGAADAYGRALLDRLERDRLGEPG